LRKTENKKSQPPPGSRKRTFREATQKREGLLNQNLLTKEGAVKTEINLREL